MKTLLSAYSLSLSLLKCQWQRTHILTVSLFRSFVADIFDQNIYSPKDTSIFVLKGDVQSLGEDVFEHAPGRIEILRTLHHCCSMLNEAFLQCVLLRQSIALVWVYTRILMSIGYHRAREEENDLLE